MLLKFVRNNCSPIVQSGSMYVICKFSVDFFFSLRGQQYLLWKWHCTIFLWALQAGWFGCDLYIWVEILGLSCWIAVVKWFHPQQGFYNVSQQWFSLEGREIKQYQWCIWHMLALTFSHKRFNYLKWHHSLLLHNPGPHLFSEQLQFLLLPRPVVSTSGSRPLGVTY